MWLVTGTRRVRCGVPRGKSVSKGEQPGEWLRTQALLRKLALTQIPGWSVQLSHLHLLPIPVREVWVSSWDHGGGRLGFSPPCAALSLCPLSAVVSPSSITHGEPLQVGKRTVRGTGKCRTPFLLLSHCGCFDFSRLDPPENLITNNVLVVTAFL